MIFFQESQRVLRLFIWSTYPKTLCQAVVGFVQRDFREKLSRWSKCPTHLLRIIGAKTGRKLMGYV